ncbi:MAG: sigma-70 family RNA polymerase sigma factor [Ruminococcus sp.]|nr:sigma-70 family RNA polymerase sigma factor [Ruminococcus sp.]
MTRDERIAENLGLVHACANRFRNRGLEYDDLFSAGCIGLCKAADGFDEALGFAFSTYAVPAILGEIRRLFRDGGAVKVSRTLKERARAAQKVQDALAAQWDRTPTVCEIAEKMGISEYETAELLNLAKPPLSLTEFDGEDERQTDIPVPSGEEEIQNRLALGAVLEALPDTDRKLIELRYYQGLTQVKTAEALGLSQVQVSRRERAILLEMRKRLTG